MTDGTVTTPAQVDSSAPNPLIDVDPASPAPGADEKASETPAPTEETGEAAQEETTEQKEAREKSRYQRRLDRQKTARVQAETEARIYRERLEKLEAQQKPQQDEEPKREDFDDVFEYNRALAKHAAQEATREALKAEREERQSRETKARAAVGEEKIAQDWQAREDTFKTATKDYLDVVNPFIEEDAATLSPEARRAIVELGPEVLYHLATHPDVVEKLADLTPSRQVIEIGKLDLTPAPKKASEAPPPIKPVGQGRTPTQGYSENMTDAEYKAWRARSKNPPRWASK